MSFPNYKKFSLHEDPPAWVERYNSTTTNTTSPDLSKIKLELSMETAKDILEKHRRTGAVNVPLEDALRAVEEIADKAWEAPLDAAIHKFEEAKKSAGTLNDMVFIDVVLAVLDSIKSGKSRDKETFMKSLFPETKI